MKANHIEAMKLALEALQTLHDENMDYLTRNKLGGENNQCMVFAREAITALREALAEQPAQQQEPVGPEPFGYFQYDIRLDAWVQNRINNKGTAFYTTGDIRALKHRIHDQDLMLERQTARIVDLQTHIANLEGED